MQDYKNNKILELIKEMVKVPNQTDYEINGVDTSRAIYFYRKEKEKFKIIPLGSYTIVDEASNKYLRITDSSLLGEATEFQVCYLFIKTSSSYVDEFPEITLLQEHYNQLYDDFNNLLNQLKSNNILGDTLKMSYVLPQLNEGQVWVLRQGEMKAENIFDLDERLKETLEQIKVLFSKWVDETEKPRFESFVDEKIISASDELNSKTELEKIELEDYTEQKKNELDIYLTGRKPIQYATIAELQASNNLKNGDYVEVTGYYTVGDGANHKRIIRQTDDGSGVQLDNGLWANLITNDKTNLFHFGITKENIKNKIEILRKAVKEKKVKQTPKNKFYLKKVGAEWRAENNFPVTFYGDSTTDGYGTTGWVQNPVDSLGNAIGNTNHTEDGTANKAYSKVLQDLARKIIGNNTPKIYNAGYTDRRVDNGWALNNIEKAIFSNPYYNDTKFICIGFGLNDIAYGGDDKTLLKNYKEELECLINYCYVKEVQPVLIKSAPTYRADKIRLGEEMSILIECCIDELAFKYDLEVINLREEIENWLDTNNNPSQTWGTIIPDKLHCNDTGHRFKASYIFTFLFNNIIKTKEISNGRVLTWEDPEFIYNPVVSGFYDNGNKSRVNPNILVGLSEVNKDIATVVVYNNEPNNNLFYQALNGGGYWPDNNIPLSKFEKITCYNHVVDIEEQKYINVQANKIVMISSNIPMFFKELEFGINILTFKTSEIARTYEGYVFGYFQIFKGTDYNFIEKPNNSSQNSVTKFEYGDSLFVKRPTTPVNDIEFFSKDFSIKKDLTNTYSANFGEEMEIEFSLSRYKSTGVNFSLFESSYGAGLDSGSSVYFSSGENGIYFNVFSQKEYYTFETFAVAIEKFPDPYDVCVLNIKNNATNSSQEVSLFNKTKNVLIYSKTYEKPIFLTSGSSCGIFSFTRPTTEEDIKLDFNLKIY